ncbi:efflux RND transporter permease subunit [Bacteroides sp. 224]|uniref:efflux RND transporter permease subunit n=1 Tax=Bacteroides sp. 224 TaxID=2302936 RepID=UPI0013CFA61C|nr:efflux RND transporter permease subunit [Bacteroides sp. 224]NDV65520.1 efflux RND transporter permease subunit [Bacteroides sp. 224]
MSTPATKISSFSIILVFGCLMVLGLFLAPQLPVKLNPSRKLPVIHVSFSMYGQSAQVVEAEVTSKLEGMISRMKGVEKISSHSSNGWGSITVRLSKHANPDMCRFEVSTIIRQAWATLPSGVSYPSISLSGTSEEVNRPFLTYTINAPFSPIRIQEYISENLKPKIAEIKGVDKVDVSGAGRMIYQLEYDYKRLQNLHVSVNDIRSAIQSYLTKEFLGIGRIMNEDQKEQWIRIGLTSDYTDRKFVPAEIQIRNNEGRIIYLDQLVAVSYVEERTSSSFRINGLNSIYLSITADDFANQLQLGKQIRSLLDEYRETLPAGYELHLSYDASEYIQEEMSKIYFRSGLTIFLLLCFVLLIYRNLKYSFLILFSLIVTLSIAAIFYYFLRLEMQMFSLAGLTISLTLIIDNVIIMSDQIINRGNKKAFFSILTATLTSVGALSVILFMDESVRANLQDFTWVIIINLSVSLFVALFLVPALIDRLQLTKRTKKKKNEHRDTKAQRIYKNSVSSCLCVPFICKRKIRREKVVIGFNRVYEKIIRFMSRRKKWFAAVLILAFGLPVFLLPDQIKVKHTKGFFASGAQQELGFWGNLYNNTLGSAFYKDHVKPVTDVALGGTMRLFAQKVRNGSYSSGDRSETSLNVAASLPNGSTYEQMDALIQKMEKYIAHYPEVKQFETHIENGRRASVRILFTKEHQRSSFPHLLKSRLITKATELGGGSWSVYGVGDGFNNDVKEQAGSMRIKLLGYNYDRLNAFARTMQDSLLQYRRIKEVIIDSKFSWFKNDYTEFVFDLQKEHLIQSDIRTNDLFHSVMPLFEKGVHVSDWVHDGKVEPIKLFAKQATEMDIWNLENYPGATGDKPFKLSGMATIEKWIAPQSIAKEDQQYLLCLQYEYIGSYQMAHKVMQRTIDSFNAQFPLGYKAESESSYYWWGDGGGPKQYLLLFIIIAIIFFMTSFLFNSVKQPFVVIFIIPVSFIGLFLTFYLFDLNFDQGGFAAFILLAGITVNANIYILNEYNNIKVARPGLSPMKVYIKAWNAKVIPIFLTIVSTVLGFIPFMIGVYKEAFWFPLAAGTMGGLIFSFFAIFFFLPVFMGVGGDDKNSSVSFPLP